ncbi:hypothetical protein [Kitasatospora herbaricolor]|uniref:hypothetical protein n=1 Tax=Kitasatospora herbaricolor TaxID=68217 RepID=UPI0036D8B3B6
MIHEIERDDLIEKMKSFEGTESVPTVLEALRHEPRQVLPVSDPEVANLISIYTRRRARFVDSDPLAVSIDELLSALRSSRSERIGLVMLEHAGRDNAIWISAGGDAILSVQSFVDRRARWPMMYRDREVN